MDKKIHRTMVGGQAVIEGVMMRGVSKTALACRRADGSIDLDVWDSAQINKSHSIRKIPIIRGVINFVESLILGYKTLSKSASLAEIDEETEESEENDGSENEENSKNQDKKTNSEKKSDAENGLGAAGVFSMLLGFVIALGLFVVLPTFIVGKTDSFVHWGNFRTIVEGVIKILIFLGYLIIISKMKDIKRVYEYHGAEHKTIYCYEHGKELTPANARTEIRFHPRCGTSFLLIVLIVSIIVFSFVTWDKLWLRIVLKLVLLPIVIGVSYEIIKFAGRHDTSVMRFLLAPGLWLQRLTTREPDDSQLECAIASLKAVLTDNPEDDKW